MTTLAAAGSRLAPGAAPASRGAPRDSAGPAPLVGAVQAAPPTTSAAPITSASRPCERLAWRRDISNPLEVRRVLTGLVAMRRQRRPHQLNHRCDTGVEQVLFQLSRAPPAGTSAT